MVAGALTWRDGFGAAMDFAAEAVAQAREKPAQRRRRMQRDAFEHGGKQQQARERRDADERDEAAETNQAAVAEHRQRAGEEQQDHQQIEQALDEQRGDRHALGHAELLAKAEGADDVAETKGKHVVGGDAGEQRSGAVPPARGSGLWAASIMRQRATRQA